MSILLLLGLIVGATWTVVILAAVITELIWWLRFRRQQPPSARVIPFHAPPDERDARATLYPRPHLIAVAPADPPTTESKGPLSSTSAARTTGDTPSNGRPEF